MKRFEKHLLTKALPLVLCGAMAFGSSAVAASVPAADSSLKTGMTAGASGAKTESSVSKDETVYVIAGADGSTQKVIVSDWLKNPDAGSTLSDRSTLSGIENVKGEETFTTGDNDALTWNANGKDIYYQGVSDQTPPVTFAIHYTLDGKEVSASEIAGKSGRVSIRFDYTNHETRRVEVNGTSRDVCVPFLALTGIFLSNDHFTNVEVTNARLANDGDRTIIIGAALPGLAESLNLDSDTISLPESFEITADATNFELLTSVTVVTNELFSKINLSNADELSGLSDSMDALTSAVDQLTKGSADLSTGLNTLLDKSGDLIAGIDALAAGAGQLASGAAQLDQGAGALKSGSASLVNGLNQLTANNAALSGGAKQVFESLLAMADTQLAAAGLQTDKLTIENYSTVLGKLLSSLDESNVRAMAESAARTKVEAAVRAQESVIRAQVESAVQAQVLEGVLKAAGKPMTAEQYQAAVAAGQIPAEMQAQVEAAVSAQMASAQIQATISSAVESKIQELVDQNMQSADVVKQIEAAVESAKAGASSLASLKAQLDSYNEFYQGLLTYTAGVASAKDGAAQLASGAATLKNGSASLSAGATELKNGLASLQSGSSALVDGVKQLADGAKQLADGFTQFKEQGIEKLVGAVEGDLEGLLDGLTAVCDASKDYASFAGIGDNMNGSVRFIYRTEAVKAAD